jgi:divalent metal cation (Fe/Co/Zn/Cd) transporter
VLFTLGGLFSLYEGYHKALEALEHPEGELVRPSVALAILAFGLVAEGLSFRTAVRQSRPLLGGRSWWQFVRSSKLPELTVVLLEDLGALVGLTLAFVGVSLAALTGNLVWDAAATLAIGLLLLVIAIILVLEMRSLLLGEAASPEQIQQIEKALAGQGVESIIHLRTLHLGPEELLVAAKIAVSPECDARSVAQAIDDAEARVRDVVPSARLIFLEPDMSGRRAAAGPGRGVAVHVLRSATTAATAAEPRRRGERQDERATRCQ